MQAVVMTAEKKGLDQLVWPIGCVFESSKANARLVQFEESGEHHGAEHPNGLPRKKLLQHEQTGIGFEDPLLRNRPRRIVVEPSREFDGDATRVLGDRVKLPFGDQSGVAWPKDLVGS
jgi:hypothetical protein